jgi:hypothetical protein
MGKQIGQDMENGFVRDFPDFFAHRVSSRGFFSKSHQLVEDLFLVTVITGIRRIVAGRL